MKTLKFRAWDKDTAKYVDGVGELYISILEFGTKTFYLEQMCPGRYIVEQYTGLKDKNGKEIYEGDIVKVVGVGVSRVIQSGWGEWQLCDLTNSDGNILSLGYCLGREYCEVIGNIHENPELLGGKE